MDRILQENLHRRSKTVSYLEILQQGTFVAPKQCVMLNLDTCYGEPSQENNRAEHTFCHSLGSSTYAAEDITTSVATKENVS